ncbi:hypothetical protein AB0M44_24005 [Streptosporangium subroseum]|uniref:hypothetical protein n=1 Tax=Streptosporangium subroseum TaxID=106412 RepID=UPI00341BC844
MAVKPARFRTIGGNYVIFTADKDRSYEYGGWECEGCGESTRWAQRSTANEHASICRAE